MPDDLEPVPIPITDVFDLHSIPARDAKAAVEAYLEEAYARGFRALRIIHGRGIGVQREMVRTVLARTSFVISFMDAPLEAGGWGATIVSLGESVPMAANKPMTQELATLIQQYDAVLQDAESIAKGLSSNQFNWSEPGRWSVGQCLEHLAITTRLNASKIAAAIEKGKRENRFAEGPFRYGFIQSYILRTTEPPAKFKVKAPKTFAPGPHHDPATTLEEYRKANRQFVKLAASASGLDLKRIKAPSPISGWIRWSLGVLLALNAAHDRRHLYQARQVMQASGFPKA